MSLSFMVGWATLFLSLGMLIGTIVKMYNYGIKGGLLLLSPVILVLSVVILPITGLVLVVFHPSSFDRNDSKWIKKVLSKNIFVRFFYGLDFLRSMVVMSSLTVGVVCYFLNAYALKQQSNLESRREVIDDYLGAVFA